MLSGKCLLLDTPTVSLGFQEVQGLLCVCLGDSRLRAAEFQDLLEVSQGVALALEEVSHSHDPSWRSEADLRPPGTAPKSVKKVREGLLGL